jgi:polysaccharide biosynthesis transport protein
MRPPKENVVLMNLPPDRPGQNARRTKSHSSFQSTSPGGSDLHEEESLRDIIRVLRKRRGVIFAWAVCALAIAYLYCALTKSTYTSTATLLVDKQGSSGVDVGSLSGLASSLTGEDDVKTELTTHATVLQNDTTTLMVIHELGLDKVYEYRPGLFGWNRDIKAELGRPLEQAPATRERLLKIVEGKLKVSQTADTRLITVSYTDQNPQRAAEVANAYVNEYIHEYLLSHFQATARASDWLQIQLNDLKAKVADSQQKLSDYESKTGLSVLMLGMGGGSGGSGSSGGGGGMHIPAVDKLALLNQELTAAESDRITKEAIYHLTQTQSPDVVSGLESSALASSATGPTVITEGQGLGALDQLRAQQAALRMQYGDYQTKYGPNNPHITELQGQLTSLNQSIRDELKRINERAKNDVDLARKTEDGLRRAYNEQQVQVNKLNDDTIELQVLAGEALSNRDLYNGLFTRLQEASISAGVSATNLDLVDEARATTIPTKPNWKLYPVVGLGSGLFLGIAFAFMRENLDESIVTTDQVEKIGLLPVLSYIPLIRADDQQRGKPVEGGPPVNPQEQSLLITRPNAPAAEAYRALRTAILLSSADEPLRVLLTTSPLGGDGKSTITYNLAVAFAQHGRRVLLLDGDMRKPSAHTFFHAPKAPGLSEVLTGSIPLADVMVQHESLPNLCLLPSGTTPPNPAELLDSKRFDALLEETRQQFDLILIDSPPVLMVTDPVILSTKTDGALIILRSQKTTKPVLKRAVEVLSRSYGRKLGFVVNGMDTKSVEYYYTYGYYGDNKYYGEEA